MLLLGFIPRSEVMPNITISPMVNIFFANGPVGIDRVTGWDLSESNSSSVDNVFDTYINCARED